MKSITLNIGGQDRVFYFGLGFLGRMLDETKTDMTDFDRLRIANPFKWTPIIMYYSLEYGYYRNGDVCNFTLFDITDWIEDTDISVLQRFNDAFRDSLIKDTPILPDTKKKVVKK